MILLNSFAGSSQSFNVYNSTSEKIITTSHFLKVFVKLNEEENCCDNIYFEGHLVSSSADSLTFNFSTSKVHQDLDLSKNRLSAAYMNDSPIKVIAKNDIGAITRFRSEKSVKHRDRFMELGAIAILGGIVTSINGLFFSGDTRTNLIFLGLAEMAGGLIIGLSSNKAKMVFHKENDPWKFR